MRAKKQSITPAAEAKSAPSQRLAIEEWAPITASPSPGTAPDFAQAMQSLRDATAGPHPDAALLVACDSFLALHERCERLWRERRRGYMQVIRPLYDQCEALRKTVAETPARTAAGIRAKAQVALSEHLNGTMWIVTRSLLKAMVIDPGAFEDAQP